MTRVELDRLGLELNRLINRVGVKTRKLIASKVAELPFRFQRASLAFYPKVLNVITGRLRQSIQPVSRGAGDGAWTVGLKSDVEYAGIQEYGGRTPAHEIVPRRKLALYWPGAEHPVKRVEHPGSLIREKRFFRDPIQAQTGKLIAELLREIGF